VRDLKRENFRSRVKRERGSSFSAKRNPRKGAEKKRPSNLGEESDPRAVNRKKRKGERQREGSRQKKEKVTMIGKPGGKTNLSRERDR